MNETGGREARPKVLVVDDEAFMRQLLRDALEEGGYGVDTAESGDAAIASVRRERPAAVLLDVVMPGMDGFAACAALRGLPGGESLPILMVTGLEDPATVEKAYAAGATDYVTKPVNPAQLRHHLRYVLRANRLFAEQRQTAEKLLLAGKVFDASSEMILVTDAGRTILDVNPAFVRVAGFAKEEAVGRDLQLLDAGRHPPEFFVELWRTVEAEGSWQGELWNRRGNGEIFPTLTAVNAVRDDAGQITHLVVTATDISRLRRTEQRLRYLSHFDPLTDLPNRSLFLDRLQQGLVQASRAEGIVAVLVFDVDSFKEINDSLGHQAGDRVLQLLARRLQSYVRSSDTVARLGSDEFALVLRELAHDDNGALVAQRILDVLSRPFELAGREIYVTVSIGIALFPADGREAEELLQQAEAALAFAKRQGRNRFQFFSTRMNARTRERLELKAALRRGIERDELLLHYQPKFDSRSGRLTGLEALVRWQRPGFGLVPPLDFIPLAEETGLINAMGSRILRLACRQNRRWRERGFAPVPVAVNLSAHEFRQKDLADEVARVLEETGLEPAGLELEITESALMQDTEGAVLTLGRLREMGIRIALDDFGTGYSSLSYLKRFPVDALKIDYSFVRNIFRNPEDAAIVRAIIAMAHSLSLRVIAEGVETEEQRVFLREQGCDEVQGYLAGMPRPAVEVEPYLASPPAGTG